MSINDSVTRRVALGCAGVTGLSLIRPSKTRAQEGDADSLGDLILQEPPVGIEHPIHRLWEAKAGQLIQWQITYPVVPSAFPKSAKAVSNSRALTVVGVFRTAGEMAVLTPKPQQGKVGVGYLSVFVKANNAGKGKITVTVTQADGTSKDVVFDVAIT